MIHEGLLTSVHDCEERFRVPAPSLHETWLATMSDAQRRSRRRRSGVACAAVILAASVTLLGGGPNRSPVAGELIAFASPVKAMWC